MSGSLETPASLRDASRGLGSLAPGGLWVWVLMEDRVRGVHVFLEGDDGEPGRQGVAALRRWLARSRASGRRRWSGGRWPMCWLGRRGSRSGGCHEGHKAG